jgi:hypothetical protein
MKNIKLTPESKTIIYFIICFIIWIPLRSSIVPNDVIIESASYDYNAGEQIVEVCDGGFSGVPYDDPIESCWEQDLNPKYVLDSNIADQNSNVNAYVNISYWSIVILIYSLNKQYKKQSLKEGNK